MIPTSQFATTGRTAPADTGSMINMDVHAASRRVQLDVGNKPRVAQPQNPRIQVRVLHGLPPGKTIAGHLPTEKSEGPTRRSSGNFSPMDAARRRFVPCIPSKGLPRISARPRLPRSPRSWRPTAAGTVPGGWSGNPGKRLGNGYRIDPRPASIPWPGFFRYRERRTWVPRFATRIPAPIRPGQRVPAGGRPGQHRGIAACRSGNPEDL